MKFCKLEPGDKFLKAGDIRIYVKEKGPNGNNARVIGTYRQYVVVLPNEIVKVVTWL